MSVSIDLTGKTALVSGASRGIGAQTAIMMSQAGAQVILVARSKKNLESVRERMEEPDRHQLLEFDLMNTGDLRPAVEAVSQKCTAPVSILVCNAGGPKSGPLREAGIETLEEAFRTHVLASQVLVQTVLPGMMSLGYGRVINVISTSVKMPIANLGVSNTIRGAVANWSKTLSLELAEYGITVNNVLPGYTETERLEELIEATSKRLGKSTEDVANLWRAQVPADRFGQPTEIAAAIAFLASPLAGYINGINLPVDGGRTGCL